MDGKIAIILLSTLVPSLVVGYVLRTNGKTLNFSVIGGTAVYVVSIVLIYASFFVAPLMNMHALDLIPLLPIVVAAFFYFFLKNSDRGEEE